MNNQFDFLASHILLNNINMNYWQLCKLFSCTSYDFFIHNKTNMGELLDKHIIYHPFHNYIEYIKPQIIPIRNDLPDDLRNDLIFRKRINEITYISTCLNLTSDINYIEKYISSEYIHTLLSNKNMPLEYILKILSRFETCYKSLSEQLLKLVLKHNEQITVNDILTHKHIFVPKEIFPKGKPIYNICQFFCHPNYDDIIKYKKYWNMANLYIHANITMDQYIELSNDYSLRRAPQHYFLNRNLNIFDIIKYRNLITDWIPILSTLIESDRHVLILNNQKYYVDIYRKNLFNKLKIVLFLCINRSILFPIEVVEIILSYNVEYEFLDYRN